MAKTRYTRITSSFLHKVLLLCKTTHRVYYTFYTRENHLHNAYTHFHQFPHSDNLPVFYLTNSLTHTHAHSRTLTLTHLTHDQADASAHVCAYELFKIQDLEVTIYYISAAAGSAQSETDLILRSCRFRHGVTAAGGGCRI